MFRFATIFAFVLFVSISIGAQKKVLDKNPLARLEEKINSGKLTESERELFDYVIANPNDANGFALLAKLRLKQNRSSEAKSLANKSLALNGGVVSAKFTLAEAIFQLGEIEQAKSFLNQIFDNLPTDNLLLLKLAELFDTVGDCPKSLDITEKLPLKIRNSEALPLRAKCLLITGNAKVFGELIQVAKSLAKQNPRLATNFAVVLSNSSLHKDAADLLRQVLTVSPQNSESIILLTKSEIYLRDFTNAKMHISLAEKLEPNSPRLLYIKAIYESEQGNDAEAFSLLEKGLTSSPDNVEFLSQIVISAMRSNQSLKAFRNAERLIAIQPANADYLYLYGAASLQNSRLTEAETSLAKFFEIRPNDSRGCLALGLAYAANPDKVLQAQNQMLKCLTLNPNNFEASYQLGLSYKSSGDLPKASEYLEQTVRLSPEYASALRDLGSVYLQSGNELKARPILEKSVLLNPNDADTNFQLSRLYNLIGERELAKKHLEIFQKLRNPKKEGM
jgi:tetratricopeptide (TPR) repeat protein